MTPWCSTPLPRPKEILTMKSSTKDQVAGNIYAFKVKVKEDAGEGTDNPRRDSERTAEKNRGSIQKKVGEVEKVRGK